jgi:penicillin-binding protein 2
MNDDVMRYRLRLIGVISMSLFVALGARLWYLQVLNTEVAEQRALANNVRTIRDIGPRGRILDVNGNILVDNKVVNEVRIDKVIWNQAFPKSKKAEELATVTKLAVEISRSGRLTKVAEIARTIENAAPLEKVPIASDVDPALLLYIGERPDEFPGVTIELALVRDYPYGNLAAHVLGYVGRINGPEYESLKSSPKAYGRDDGVGKTGVEKIFESELRGTPGTREFIVDSSERVLREVTERRVDPVPGNDVWLTIDINLQRRVEQELARALVDARSQVKRNPDDPDITAPAGAAVVLDPRTGAVRAMASYPTFSPKDFVGGISQAKYQTLTNPANFTPLVNRATEGQYAPGSTFKMVSAYAALEGGFMAQGRLPGPEARAFDNGIFDLTKFDRCEGQCIYRNALDGKGIPTVFTNVDMVKSLAVSSDTYYYRIGAEIGLSKRPRYIQTTAEKFGFGRVSGIQLPGEAAGIVPDQALKQKRHAQNPTAFPFGDWTTGDDINLSVGQGDVLSTPLQLANSYAVMANGGHVFAPNIASQVKAIDGSVIRTFDPRELDTITLDEKARRYVLDGLLGVISYTEKLTGEHGTGYNAFNAVGFDIERWPIAGKTGTAEVNGKADTALFVAFGPTPDPTKPNTAELVPEYVMSVVLEQSGFGGANAAPVVANVFFDIFRNQVEKAYSERVLAACAAKTAAEIAAAAQRAPAAGGPTANKSTTGSTGATGTTTARSGAVVTPMTTTTRVAQLREGESCP